MIVTQYRKKNLLELIDLAQNDDERALDEILRRHQNKVYNAFCSLNPDGELSDLTQDALFRMSKSIKNLKNPEKFNAWLRQIVHNIFCDSMRKKNRQKELPVDNSIKHADKDEHIAECIIDETKTPDENSLSCELNRKINEAIDELPPLFKTIILLREVDGLSYDEIARLTKLNIGTVKSRLARARVKLQKELEPYLR